MPLAEVLTAAGDIVSGILTAKGAAQAAQAAADAAKQAQASAEKVGWLQQLSGFGDPASHAVSPVGFDVHNRKGS
jgi:hypothetical protein